MKSIIVLLTLTYYLLTLFGQCHCQAYGCPNPKDWVRFRDTDHCFYISPEFETYETGKKFCESQNSQLAQPLTCSMQFHLSTLLAYHRLKCPKNQNCNEFWIGIQNLNGKTWTTADGFEIDKNSACLHWDGNFPRGGGRCVYMSYLENIKRGSWRNADCNKKIKFVCVACPNSYTYLPEINECVYFNPKPLPWAVAQKSCAGMKYRSQLLTIKSPVKEEAIKRYLKPLLNKQEYKACDNSKFPSLGKLIWLSGQTRDPKNCNTPFIWRAPVPVPTNIEYAKWFPGMPKCVSKNENCVVVSTDPQQNYQWKDIPCNENFCSVCEY